MLISIIIPAYNAETFIENCIESIVKFNQSEMEIIIVNDGSTDNTLLICEKLVEKYSFLRVFSIRNSGPIAARQYGVNKALGDYIMHVDADDTLIEGGVDRLVQCLDTDVDVIVSDTGKNNIADSERYCSDLLLGRIKAHIWGNLYRRSIFQLSMTNICRQVTMAEDLIQNLLVALFAQRIKYVDVCVYNYQYNSLSITKTFRRTYEYERFFRQVVYDKFIGSPHYRFSENIEICVNLSFLNGCKKVLLDRGKIDYQDVAWKQMHVLLSPFRGQLHRDEKIVFDIHNSLIARYLLLLLYKIESLKKFFR